MTLLFPFIAQAAQQNSTNAAELVLAVLCVVVASTVALAVSVGFARRMQQIANKPRTEDGAPDDADED